MTQKTLIAVGFACAAALAIGFGIGWKSGSGGLERGLTEGAVVRREALDEALRERDVARAKLGAAEVALADARGRTKDLEGKVTALGKGDEAAAAEKVAAASRKKAPVSFGKYGGLEGIQGADWAEVGAAAEAMNGLLARLVEELKEGRPVGADLQAEIREQNNRLVKFAASIMGKIPTNCPMNGEYTHPVALANLMASLLEHGGQGLTEEQTGAIARLGEEYEEAYEDLQKGYGKETPALRKIADELELKSKFMEGAEAGLSEEQRAIAARPELHDRMQVDILSPFLSAILIAQPTYVDSAEELRGQATQKIVAGFKLSEGQQAAVGPIVDAYLADLEPILREPVVPGRTLLTLDQALVAAWAQLKVFDAVLQLPELDAAARAQVLSAPNWSVPQLKKKE